MNIHGILRNIIVYLLPADMKKPCFSCARSSELTAVSFYAAVVRAANLSEIRLGTPSLTGLPPSKNDPQDHF